jgi:hypothetical protein
MTKRNPRHVASVILAALCVCGALIAAPQTVTADIEQPINISMMSAEGVFDRVELVDRHYGVVNGQEVEGELLAVLYENGSIEISTEHYLVIRGNYFYEGDTNYPFFLYVYDGTDHLRERISVESGTSEDFIYLSVTVTVYLGTTTGIAPYTAAIGIVYAILLGIAGAVFWIISCIINPMKEEPVE